MTLASLEDGYAALAESEAKWLAEGRTPAGFKVGLTTALAQQHFGTDRPCFGRLFTDMRIEDGGVAEAGRFARPRIEAEIAFRIGTDGADALLPAIEIVESRYPKGPAGIAELVADNTSGAGFVLGAPVALAPDLDLASCRARVWRNGKDECEGFGSACLGSPLRSLEWLRRELAKHGRALAPGDIVLSGSLIVPFEALPGDEIRVTFDGLGAVSVRFAFPCASEDA